MATKKKPTPKDLGSGMAARAASSMQTRNARQKSAMDEIMGASNAAMGVSPVRKNSTKPNKPKR
jgi:hypothetical protein